MSHVSANPPAATRSALAGKEGVCLIEVTRVEWMWQQPWHSYKQAKSSGSGFVIEGNRIMTCSHVVEYAIDVRVRLHGRARKFPAKIVCYAPDVDLALLEIVEDQHEEFFQGTGDRPVRAAEFATDLPDLQDKIHVCGFPTGGTTICITEGVVSRVDETYLNVAQGFILTVQIDAAINSGNSGGPCYTHDGKVAGVAFCKSSKGSDDNIGYIISSQVIRAFLGRVAPDGTYTLAPSMPFFWRKLENHSLRLAHNVPDGIHGVLITHISPKFTNVLNQYDVLTKIDGCSLADDGQVTLRRDELIKFSFLLLYKNIDTETRFTVYRDGKEIETGPCIIKNIPMIYKQWPDVDHNKNYLILGALVLLPMSKGLMDNKNAGTTLRAESYEWGKLYPEEWGEVEELVVLTEILAHEISFSYETVWRRVKSYNGVPVKSLRHLSEMWDVSCAEATTTDAKKRKAPAFARIELSSTRNDIVFEVLAAMQAQEEILQTHQIPKPAVLDGPNPKYKFG